MQDWKMRRQTSVMEKANQEISEVVSAFYRGHARVAC